MAEMVGKVTDQEKEELKELFERKVALENLKILNLDELLSIRINKDLEKNQFLMQEWWQNYATKYNWKGKGSDKHWELSFSSGEILLV